MRRSHDLSTGLGRCDKRAALRRIWNWWLSGHSARFLGGDPRSFQRLIVEPNELKLETPFLRHNIALTGRHGLDNIDVRFHSTEKKARRDADAGEPIDDQ